MKVLHRETMKEVATAIIAEDENILRAGTEVGAGDVVARIADSR